MAECSRFIPDCLLSFISFTELRHRLDVSAFRINRQKLTKALFKLCPKGVVLMKGSNEPRAFEAASDSVFRQDSNFLWTFGVQEPDFWGALDVFNDKSYLFVPRFDEEYAICQGPPLERSDIQNKYMVDHVHFVDEIEVVVGLLSPQVIFLPNIGSEVLVTEKTGINLKNYKYDCSSLRNVISELRLVKNRFEIDLLRKVNLVSSFAHKMVMKNIDKVNFEYQAEAIFRYCIGFIGGCRSVARSCNCSSGEFASILHYGSGNAPNQKKITKEDMCLFNMGARLYGYSSDISCSFPASGLFTEDQKNIYACVLKSREIALETIRPGIDLRQVHERAGHALLTSMIEMGLLKGAVKEMIERGLLDYFLPHSVGHMIGIDVYDSDCSEEEARLSRFNHLSIQLEPGMVLIIEPGLYFNPTLMEKLKNDESQAHFINEEEIDRFEEFGGLRIGDCVAVTHSGFEMLSDVPRTVEEIERWINSDGKEGEDYFMEFVSEKQKLNKLSNFV